MLLLILGKLIYWYHYHGKIRTRVHAISTDPDFQNMFWVFAQDVINIFSSYAFLFKIAWISLSAKSCSASLDFWYVATWFVPLAVFSQITPQIRYVVVDTFTKTLCLRPVPDLGGGEAGWTGCSTGRQIFEVGGAPLPTFHDF